MFDKTYCGYFKYENNELIQEVCTQLKISLINMLNKDVYINFDLSKA